MRSHAHGFLPAGDHDFGVTVKQRLIAQRHRTQTAAAQLVDAPCRAFDRNAGRNRSLSGGVLALRGSEDLAHDDFRNTARLDAGALQRGLDGDGAQIVGRQRRESTVEASDRGAGGADDDDIV